MRFLAHLNRRYTPAHSALLLVCAITVVVGTRIAAVSLGATPLVAGLASFALGVGVFITAGVITDRRTRA